MRSPAKPGGRGHSWRFSTVGTLSGVSPGGARGAAARLARRELQSLELPRPWGGSAQGRWAKYRQRPSRRPIAPCEPPRGKPRLGTRFRFCAKLYCLVFAPAECASLQAGRVDELPYVSQIDYPTSSVRTRKVPAEARASPLSSGPSPERCRAALAARPTVGCVGPSRR